MPPREKLIGSVVHLTRLPRADEALRMLQLIISAVLPIMRNHRWRVGKLAEFYPDEDDLLGTFTVSMLLTVAPFERHVTDTFLRG